MMPYPRRILVSHIEHVKAALTAGERLGVLTILQTSPELLKFAGTPFIAALADEAAKTGIEHVFIADAGDNSGYAMSLIRLGVKHLIFSGNKELHEKIISIARQNKTEITEPATELLNLSEAKNPLQACMTWLA